MARKRARAGTRIVATVGRNPTPPPPVADARNAAGMTRERALKQREANRVMMTPQGAAQRTLDKAEAATKQSAELLENIDEAVATAFEGAFQVGAGELNAEIGAEWAAVDAVADRVVRDRRLTPTETLEVFIAMKKAVKGGFEWAIDEVASVRSSLKETRIRVAAAEALTRLIPSLSGRVADLINDLQHQGMFDSGDAMKNLAAGAIFINNQRFDVKSFLLALVMLRAAKPYKDIPSDKTYVDRLWSTAPQMDFVRHVATTTNGVVSTVTFDPEIHTDAALLIPATGFSALAAFPTPIAKVAAIAALNLKKGDVLPSPGTATAQYLWYERAHVRMSHDSDGLLTALAAIGITFVHHPLAQIVPAFSNTISGLAKIVTGTDYSRSTP